MAVAASLALLASPADFAEHFSRVPLKLGKHQRMAGDAIADAVFANELSILIIEMPPQHGKSTIVSQWSPAWFFSLFPRKNAAVVAYEAGVASRWGGWVRDTLTEIGTVKIADGSKAKDEWCTTEGGMMITVGVGGPLTSYGINLLIVDDPFKNAEEADSQTIRQKVWDWFLTVAWTRKQPGTVFVIMHTRWHEDDLVGRILDNPEMAKLVKRINLPALAEDNDAMGRKPGEALWPERYPADNTPDGLLTTKAVLPPRWWNALYQQRPSAQEGAEIKRHWWRWYDELPVPWTELDYRLVSVDATFRDTDGSDYVVIQTWGVYGAFRYLLDQTRERLGFVDTCKALESICAKWKPMVTVIEGKANGDAIGDALQYKIGKIDILDPMGGKQARARSASGDIYTGNVLLPRTEWAAQLVEESAAFPLGKHDDMVDAAAMALIYLRHFYRPKASALAGPDRIMTEDTRRELERRGLLGGRALFSIRKELRRAI